MAPSLSLNMDQIHESNTIYLSINIFSRQTLKALETRGQLSRRTVSNPLQSILSCLSGFVQYNPA